MKKEDLQMLLFPSIFRLLAKGVFTKCLFSFLAIFLAVLDFIPFFRSFLRLFQNRKPAIVSHKISRPRKPVTSYTVQKELK